MAIQTTSWQQASTDVITSVEDYAFTSGISGISGSWYTDNSSTNSTGDRVRQGTLTNPLPGGYDMTAVTELEISLWARNTGETPPVSDIYYGFSLGGSTTSNLSSDLVTYLLVGATYSDLRTVASWGLTVSDLNNIFSNSADYGLATRGDFNTTHAAQTIEMSQLKVRLKYDDTIFPASTNIILGVGL